jgi:ribokinase
LARLLLFGHLTVDDTVMPDGRSAMGTLGGNVIYATVGAHLWTDDLAMVSRLGRRYPQSLLDQIAAAGLRVDGLVPTTYNRIRQWQLYDDEGGRTYVPLASSGTYEDLAPRAAEIPATVSEDVRACHIAPMPIARQAELVLWARERGAHVTLDPHPDWIAGHEREWRQLLPMVDVFLPSREEACALLGQWPGADEAARRLTEFGAGVVCLKLGAEGALVYRAEDGWCRRCDSALSDPVDTTGCGDAFCGGFLAGWREAGDLGTAVLYGTVSATFVAEDFGASSALRRNQPEARSRLARLSEAGAS